MRRLPRAAFAALLGLALLGAGPVAAVEPIDFRDGEAATSPTPEATPPPRMPRSMLPPEQRQATSPSPSARPTPSPSPAATPTLAPTPVPASAPGFDISFPQCGRDYPEQFSFAIVGVNGGRVYSPNPCLGPGEHRSQLEWAGREAELYVNTGNPGPRLSRYWPAGQTEPRACDTRDAPGDDTADCAYVYGWNAAEDSYRTALEAFVALGWAHEGAETIPGEIMIWLDVEPANSWRGDRQLNIAALEGAVAHFESRGAEVGFYSTPRLWNRITGGTDVFDGYPAWHAGASDRADAERRCADRAFTGGELRMVQWVEDGFDANLRCAEVGTQ